MGLALQIALALLLLKLPLFREAFLQLNRLVLALEAATAAGTGLVFGYLGGAPLPFTESAPGTSYILAIRALPLVLVMSALSALLYYWRVLPYVVGAFPGCCARLCGWGARWVSARRPTYSWAWWRRRCWCGPI